MSEMPKDTQILVTGGTGFLGAYLIRYLLQSGFTRIRALKRAGSKFDLLDGMEDQVEWVETDLLDIVGVEEAMAGVRQLYHCAALVSFEAKDKDRLLAVNRDGTANIVNAALYAGVEKLVHVSSIAAIGRDKKTHWVSEETKWVNSAHNTNYGISKFQAEQEVWRGQAEGLQVAVVNPSVILGAGFWNTGTPQFFKMGWNEFPFYTKGETGLVDVRDVARFMILLMESDTVGERFILNGANVKLREMQNAIAREMDRNPPRFELTPFMARWAARLDWLRSKLTGRAPLITRENAKTTGLTYHYQNEKSIRAFDFQYTPLEDTIREVASLFREAVTEDLSPKVLPLKGVEQLKSSVSNLRKV